MNQTQESRRFEVKKWSPIAFWSWNIQVENCAICKNHIMENCIACDALNPEDPQRSKCEVSWGLCSHAYHQHCLEKWLKNRNTCPLDNQTWQYDPKKTS